MSHLFASLPPAVFWSASGCIDRESGDEWKDLKRKKRKRHTTAAVSLIQNQAFFKDKPLKFSFAKLIFVCLTWISARRIIWRDILESHFAEKYAVTACKKTICISEPSCTSNVGGCQFTIVSVIETSGYSRVGAFQTIGKITETQQTSNPAALPAKIGKLIIFALANCQYHFFF